MTQIIVFTGGPSTGKTSLINELIKHNYYCMPEISREIISKAQKKGIEKLFESKPIFFSELLLKERNKQFKSAQISNHKYVFIDRGIPDIVAYLNYSNIRITKKFLKDVPTYHKIFIFPPWKEIYKTDKERLETFEESVKIYDNIKKTYTQLGFDIIEVPKLSINDRLDFLLNNLT